MHKLTRHIRWEWWVLIGILLLAGGLRFYRIGFEDAWLDEIASINRVHTPLAQVFSQPVNQITVTYFLIDHVLLRFWMFFGSSVAYIRSFAAVCSLLTVLAIYQLGSYLFNRNTGLLAALLLSLSSLHLYYAQEARAYSLQMLLVVLMAYFLARGVHENKHKYWFAYGLFTMLAIYVQLFSFFSWCALLGGVVLLGWRTSKSFHWKPFIVSSVGIMLLIAPYLIYMQMPGKHGALGWIPKTDWNLVRSTYSYFLLGKAYILFPMWSRVLLYVFSLGLIGYSLVSHNDIKREWGLRWLLLGMSVLPILMEWMVSLRSPIFIPDRYTVMALPFFILLLAASLTVIPQKWLQSLGCGVLVACMAWGIHCHWQGHYKISWSKAVQWLNTHPATNETLIICPGYWGDVLRYYLQTPMTIVELRGNTDRLQLTKDAVQNQPRVWFVSVTDTLNQTPLEITQYMQSNYSACTIHTEYFPSQVDIICYTRKLSTM